MAIILDDATLALATQAAQNLKDAQHRAAVDKAEDRGPGANDRNKMSAVIVADSQHIADDANAKLTPAEQAELRRRMQREGGNHGSNRGGWHH